MALQDQIKDILSYGSNVKSILDHNNILFNIYEGSLSKYIEEDLKTQLSPQTFNSIQARITPINVLRRLVEKLSRIYISSPLRQIVPDNDSNINLLNFYTTEMEVDAQMHLANAMFNLFKTTLIEPYIYKGFPRLRIVPSDRFYVYSNDPVNPTIPTHVVKIQGKYKIGNEPEKTIYYVYSKDEFLIIDNEGSILRDMMIQSGNPEGINPYGVLPFVYVNRSSHSLIPLPDSDLLQMTKIIPILLSDLSLAIQYQSFSIIYGIDVDFTNMTHSPNSIWQLKSDGNSDKPPQIGSIKPDVDINNVLEYIQGIMSLWFQSRNIRPGSVGNLSADNTASGISKIIDEADTSEDRSIQTKFFKDAEESLWDLIINNMHPVWLRDSDYKQTIPFVSGTIVNVSFPIQKPAISSTQATDDAIKKLDKGLISKTQALKEIYPDKSEEEIDDMYDEANEENTIEIMEEEENGLQDKEQEKKTSEEMMQ